MTKLSMFKYMIDHNKKCFVSTIYFKIAKNAAYKLFKNNIFQYILNDFSSVSL